MTSSPCTWRGICLHSLSCCWLQCFLQSQVFSTALSCRRQTQQGFIRSLLLRLLDIAQAAAAGPYAWLASREAGQGSAANAIKVAVWQALCVLAPWVDDELAPEVGSSHWGFEGSMKFGVKCVSCAFGALQRDIHSATTMLLLATSQMLS
jgi:hypothetical protein